MPEAPSKDREQLRLLAIFHYVIAALAVGVGGFFLIYAALGGFMLHRPDFFTDQGQSEPPPAFVGGLLIALGVGLFAAAVGFAVALAVAGRSLWRQVRYTYCLIIAGLCCLFTPWGTVLGVFTIVVLMRPAVKAMFGRPP